MDLTLPPKLVRFVHEHHVMTIATSVSDEPHCFAAFYAYLENENMFAFLSDNGTRHVQDFSHNIFVAASIVLETKTVAKIQGLQLRGMVHRPHSEGQADAARSAYLHRFPYAVLAATPLWLLEPTWAKLTDNRLGFGKKEVWEKIRFPI
jgi:uncharacterized protein YhbP (UPF0306 family)